MRLRQFMVGTRWMAWSREGLAAFSLQPNDSLVPVQEPLPQLEHLTASQDFPSCSPTSWPLAPGSPLNLPPAVKTPYSLSQLPPTYTESLTWDISLYSYRRQGTNISEELPTIKKTFALNFHDWTKLENTGNFWRSIKVQDRSALYTKKCFRESTARGWSAQRDLPLWVRCFKETQRKRFRHLL